MIDPVLELFEIPEELYGILQVKGEETIIQLSNEFAEIKTIDSKTTKLQKKQSHGGQSKNRIERLRQESIHNYLKLAGEKAMRIFTKNNLPLIKGLLVIGPGIKKEQILNYIKIPVPTIVKSSELDTSILPHVTELIQSISSSESANELKIIEDILQRNPDLLAFGDDIKSDNIKTVYDNVLVINKFGGPVGIKYYAQIDGYEGFENDTKLNCDENSKKEKSTDETDIDKNSIDDTYDFGL